MIDQVGMGTTYNQLTCKERDLIGIMLAEGRSLGDIARRIGRNKSTVSREVLRNGSRTRKDYYPLRAQSRNDKRRSKSRKIGRLKNDEIRDYVERKLKLKWSPELISGRLQKKGLVISHESIYQWIYNEKPEYITCLTRRHRRRKRKGTGKKGHKYNIPQRVGIESRPGSANDRREAGHWEVDTAFFHHMREVLHVMSERKTRYTMLTKMKDITSEENRGAMIRRHTYTPLHLRKSFTYDNGRENSHHTYVNTNLGTQSYFCNPGRSWEKGTVENTIGVIRRILPKKTKFNNITEEEIKALEDWLNDRPRKCLKFQTPREAYKLERCT